MMHTHVKIYTLAFLSSMLLLGVGFAADTDCDLSLSGVRISSGSWSKYSSVIPYADLTIAYDHLFASCCKSEDFIDMSVCAAPTQVYMESPYLFDHLIDVGFRRLDVVGAYSGQIIDSGAQAWYDFLHPSATGTLTLTPLMVQTQYKNYWSLTHSPLLQDEDGPLESYLPLYTGFSLRDKYYNLCDVVKTAYEKRLQANPKNWAVDIGNQYNPSSLYGSCMNLAEQKVNQELMFAQTLMIERSTSTLETTIQSYTMVNFVKDRLMTLMEKLKTVVALFEKIAKQAPLSKRCSQ